MANMKTAISLQESLFEQIDTLAHEMKVPRSRLFVLALEEYLHRHQNRQLLARINEACEKPPDADERRRLQRMRRHHRRMVEGEW